MANVAQPEGESTTAENGHQPLNGLDGYKKFLTQHRNQLESSGVPQHFWQTLYSKLVNVVSLQSLRHYLPVHSMVC